MFKFPGLKNNYFLGIDFGTHSIKVVELLYKKSGVYLSNYGWIEIPLNKNKSLTQDEKNKQIGEALKKLIDEMRIESTSAHISMGAFKGLSTLIEVSDIEEENIEEIVKAEANKYIPISLDEVYLSWDIVSRKNKKKFLEKVKGIRNNNKEKKYLEILLVAAPKEEVYKYEKIVNIAGIKVKSLELDIFSLTRALVGDDLGTFLIIDMGAKITNIVLIRKGVIRINRNINVGGDEITKNVMSGLNISWDRAEEFKKKNNYLSGEGKSMLMPVIDTIKKESERVIDLGLGSNKSKIDSIIITGGGVDISGIENIFYNSLGLKAKLGNPWKKIIIENDILKKKTSEIVNNLSVATGLALKGVAEYKRK